MQIVKDIANRVAVMQDGQLIEEGSVLIFSNPQQDELKTSSWLQQELMAMGKIEQQEIVKHLAKNSLW